MMQGDGGVRAGVRETANLACGARGGRPIFSLLLRYRRVAWEKTTTSRMMPWSRMRVLLPQYGSYDLTLVSSVDSGPKESSIRGFVRPEILVCTPYLETLGC